MPCLFSLLVYEKGHFLLHRLRGWFFSLVVCLPDCFPASAMSESGVFNLACKIINIKFIAVIRGSCLKRRHSCFVR